MIQSGFSLAFEGPQPARTFHIPEAVERPVQWIDHLKADQNIAALYALSAGVSEGYTVEEHTKLVLKKFETHFSHPDHVEILEKMGLTRHQFGLFLALHDIGKGRAVTECSLASFLRKDKELAYCREVIEKIVQDPKLRNIFICLLKDDNIGDLLKQPYITKGAAVVCAQEFVNWAVELKCSPLDLANLKILFHMIDASSYPSLCTTIFQFENEKLIYRTSGKKRTELIRQILREGALKEETYELPLIRRVVDQVLTSPEYRQFEKYLQLEAYRAQAKRLGANRENSATYRIFSQRLKVLREHHMLPRVAAALKAAHSEQYGYDEDQNLLQGIKAKLGLDDGSPKQLCKRLREGELFYVESKMEKKLSILQDIKFLHGTNSGALAMMALTGQYRMACMGELIGNGIAPMSGEIHLGGCGIQGINQSSLSAETVRGMERVKRYTRNFGFNIDATVRPLLTRFDELIDGWRVEKNAGEIVRLSRNDLPLFQQLFPKEVCQSLVGNLKVMIEENKKCEYNKHKVPHQELLLELFQEEGKLPFVESVESNSPVSEDFINECRYPLYPHFKAPTSLHARLLQIRQWNEALFQEIVRTTNLKDTFLYAKEKMLGPADLILRIFKRKFTEDEKAFIQSPETVAYPASLDDIGEKKLKEVLKPKSNPNYGEAAVKRELFYYLTGAWPWNPLIKRVLQDRMGSLECPHQEALKIMSCVEEGIRGPRAQFDQFEALLEATEAKIKVPEKGPIRDFIEKSFPLTVASTCYMPQARIDRSEYSIPEAIHLGRGGIDLLITDTEEHRASVREMLPPGLREQIAVYLESEIDVGDIPLMHTQMHIKC